MSSIAWIFGSSLMSFLLLKIAASRYDGLVSTRQGRHDGRCTGEVWGSRWFKGLTFAELQPNLPSFKRLVCFKAAFQAPPWCLDRLSGSEWLVLQSMAVWPLKKMIKNDKKCILPFWSFLCSEIISPLRIPVVAWPCRGHLVVETRDKPLDTPCLEMSIRSGQGTRCAPVRGPLNRIGIQKYGRFLKMGIPKTNQHHRFQY